MSQSPTPVIAPSGEQACAPGLAERLLVVAAEDRRLAREAATLPADATPAKALFVARADHGRWLRDIVCRSGWPTSKAVGEEASTAAVTVLLGARSQHLLALCQPLIAEAVAKESTPAIHLAYVVDLLAVLRKQRQTYGTQVEPRSLEPFPIHDATSIDARRAAVGLPPLATTLTQLRTAVERAPRPTTPPPTRTSHGALSQ
ncbi:DUF6624 domain-containing protein [Streptomyces seoulensis]|uniref:DUF6624 domain-containing protein n=1 Tax=Streptomyces seoulensis TaxID=73044 RepID=UPI001FCB1FF3|nr:DUF6624 domain-containing protein [Streptomyces seoulensis]BDH07140.1 hypothetical protein HEK131_43670 [Streptomyces seoulensis]